MGWFSKKEDEKEMKKNNSNPGELPKLPDLPGEKNSGLNFPSIKDYEKRELSLPSPPAIEEKEKLPKLPSYPTDSFGDKFSQNAIKHAVSGGKEVNLEDFEDDSEEDEDPMMKLPRLKKPMTHEISGTTRMPIASREIPEEFKEAARTIRKDPVFIRIDKFESSLKIFEKTKEKVMEIEDLLSDIKHVKEQEEKELENWSLELGQIKEQIEKIDKNIFSKVE